MTDDDWLSAGVPIEYIYSRGNLASHGPYYFFLKEMQLDITYNNFEANYLSAMMSSHPAELNRAKENFYSAVMDLHKDEVAALEWLMITKEILGPDIGPD